MVFVIFMQQSSDSNWVPFFRKTYQEANQLADELMMKVGGNEYDAYYIGEVLSYSYDFHTKELGDV